MKNFDLEVVYLSPSELIPYPHNAKLHPPEQIDLIAGKIALYGFDQPIVVNSDRMIIKGHGRREAAIKLGLEKVPVIVRSDLSAPEQIGARLSDNRVAESGWDNDMVKLDLNMLDDDPLKLSEFTGFSLSEIGLMSSGWQSDHSMVEGVPENLDGIGAVIKIKCAQEARAELKSFLETQLKDSGFEDVEIE